MEEEEEGEEHPWLSGASMLGGSVVPLSECRLLGRGKTSRKENITFQPRSWAQEETEWQNQEPSGVKQQDFSCLLGYLCQVTILTWSSDSKGHT